MLPLRHSLNIMEVTVNQTPVELDREMIKLGDLLGYAGIKRIPGMTINVNGKPVKNSLWVKFPILDGDEIIIHSSEEVKVAVRK